MVCIDLEMRSLHSKGKSTLRVEDASSLAVRYDF